MKTIALPEGIYQDLIRLKLTENKKTAAELVNKLLLEYKKNKFHSASNLFRKKISEKNIELIDLLRKSRRIREEIVDEWL